MEEPDQRGRILVEAATNTGLVCRTIGGVGIRLLCPTSTALDSLHRELNDLDLVTVRNDADRLAQMLEGHGVMPERRFNLLHGEKRLLFHDPETGKHLDVFIDVFEMCHKLDLRARLDRNEWTLAPSDLLLTKLQIARITEKDVKDLAALALESDAPMSESWFDPTYLVSILGNDWGWWKTVSDNLGVAAASVNSIGLDTRRLSTVTEVLGQLTELATGCVKSRRWTWRSRIGTRIPWREEPEEAQR